jgi:Uma2 family endonuclease
MGQTPEFVRERPQTRGRDRLAKLMTADELLRLSDDKACYELRKGKLVMLTPATPKHGKVAMQIGRILANFVIEHDLGEVYAAETGFKLAENPDTVRAPDAAFVARDRIPPPDEQEGYWVLAPDLVVEVVSLHDRAKDLQTKVSEWLEAGVQLVWVVYPESQLVVEYRSFDQVRLILADAALDGGRVLPGFTCPLAEIFA